MDVPKNWNAAQRLEMLVSCMEVDLTEAEVKALREGLISKKVFDNLMSLKSKVPVAERCKTLLMHVHEALLERLIISDAQAAAKQAWAEGLIEQCISCNIAAINKKVPDSLKARYLLLFLQPALQKKLENFHSQLYSVKSNYTEYKDAYSRVIKYLEKGLVMKTAMVLSSVKDMEQMFDEEVKEQLSHEKERLKKCTMPYRTIVLSNAHPSENTTLGPQHLSKLNELLVKYSYKWKNIGLGLNFHYQDLQTIEATLVLLPDAPKSFLTRLLQDWLQMTLGHTLPPTAENLEKVLNSQIVGLGALGRELQAIVKKNYSFADCIQNGSYSSTKVSFDTKEPLVYPKCNEICIEEGESTLLEIIATTAGTEDPAYKWLVRGKDSGLQPILYLHNADIALDSDDILCEVKASATKSSSNITIPITVHVNCPLDKFTQSLSSQYLCKPEVPEDTWPPTGSKTYINLAIIKLRNINYRSEYVRFTIRGDIDDILQDKEIIHYSKMYHSLKSRRQVMFIEGRPGSGKTTFVHKISHDWATNPNDGLLRILLLVSLRVLNTIYNPTLSDILRLFKDLRVTPELIEKRNGNGVCFIFDGLDEFSPSDGKNSIVYRIIERSYLHQSTVIVASRPAALAELRSKADNIIEVLGFTSNQIKEYFDHYPFSDATKPVKLKAYLSLHPNILHMCYLPIHATMVAYLFEVTGQVPKTETKIYGHFTHCTLLRSVLKNEKRIKRNIGNNILQCLNKEEKCYFKQVCQLALKKTMSKKQVLDHSEISIIFQDYNISLGLICIDSTAGVYGFKDVYSFLHLTFQEYLAAYHISTLSDEEQMKLIEEHGHKNHMLVVWKFFCGLVDIKPFENRFNTLLHKTQGNILYHFQCAYESQQKIVCAQLLKAVHHDIQLANTFLSTPDFTAIGYVTNSAIFPTKLSLTNCDVDIAAIDALLSEVENTSKQSLESLHIEAKDVALDLIPEVISKFLANFLSLKFLYLKTDVVAIDAAGQDMKQSLQSLYIKGRNLTPEVIRELLATFRSLKSLSLVNNAVNINALFSEVEVTSKQWLEGLHIEAKAVTPDLTPEVISKLLVNFQTLKSLSIMTNVVAIDAARQDISKESLEILRIKARNLNPEFIPKLLAKFKYVKSLSLVSEVVAIDALLFEMEVTSKQLLECLHVESKDITPDLTPKIVSQLLANFPSLKSLSFVTDVIAIDAVGQDTLKQSHESLHIKARNLTPELIPKLLINFQSLKLFSLVNDVVVIDALLSVMEDTSKQLLESLHIQAKNLTFPHIPMLLANFKSLKSLSLVKKAQKELCMNSSAPPTNYKSKCSVLKKIQTLTLNGFWGEYKHIQMMMFALRQCENLTKLNIADNKIGELGAKYLSQSLPHCRCLQKINISQNGLMSAGVIDILRSMKRLKTIHIKADEITSQGGQDIVGNDFLLKHLKSFTNLQGLHIVLDPEHADLFMQVSKGWKDLKELRVEAQHQFILSIPVTVSRVVQLYFRSIKVFVMKNVTCDIEVAKNLSKGLLQCPDLRVLDFSCSVVTLEHLKLLLSVDYSRLEQLYFNNDQICDNKVRLLSSHLQGFPSLQVLSLRLRYTVSPTHSELGMNTINTTHKLVQHIFVVTTYRKSTPKGHFRVNQW